MAEARLGKCLPGSLLGVGEQGRVSFRRSGGAFRPALSPSERPCSSGSTPSKVGKDFLGRTPLTHLQIGSPSSPPLAPASWFAIVSACAIGIEKAVSAGLLVRPLAKAP